MKRFNIRQEEFYHASKIGVTLLALHTWIHAISIRNFQVWYSHSKFFTWVGFPWALYKFKSFSTVSLHFPLSELKHKKAFLFVSWTFFLYPKIHMWRQSSRIRHPPFIKQYQLSIDFSKLSFGLAWVHLLKQIWESLESQQFHVHVRVQCGWKFWPFLWVPVEVIPTWTESDSFPLNTHWTRTELTQNQKIKPQKA